MPIGKVDKTPGSTRVAAFADLTRADIVRQVRRLASQLASESNPVPPTPSQIRDLFGLSNNAPIENIFGATSALLNEAKLAYRLYTDNDLLRLLGAFKDSLGHDPSQEEIDADLTMPGAMHYIKRFGGIENALTRIKEGVPALVKTPPPSPRYAPLPVVARPPNGSTVVRRIPPPQVASTPPEVPSPVAAQPAAAVGGSDPHAAADTIELSKLVEVLANRRTANVLLRVMWRRENLSKGDNELPDRLTLYVELTPDRAFTKTLGVLKTSDWEEVTPLALRALGEGLHYVKGADGQYDLVNIEGKKTIIWDRLVWGRVQAPQATDKEGEQRAAQGNGIGGYAILECPIAKPFFTPADLKKVAPLVTLPVTLPTDARGYAPSRVEWKDLATKPSVGRFNGVLARPDGAKRSSEPNAVLTFLVGLAALVAGVRLLRAPNLSPAMPSGSLFLSPKEEWDRSGT